MGTVLRIGTERIPLNPEDIAITYQAKDVRNTSGASGSFAELFTLPATNQVKRALGNSHLLTSGTLTPYRVIPAAIEENGNAALTGAISHTKAGAEFEIDFVGQNADLFALVKGKQLSDIDLSDLDHLFTNNQVGTSNSHNINRGYIYPVINYGRFTDRALFPGNVRFDELRPAVYVHTLLQRMVAPYKLTGSLLNEPRYARLTVPFTNKYFQYRESFRAKYDAKATSTASERYLSTDEGGVPVYVPTFHQVDLDDSAALADNQYRVPFDGNYEVNANLTVSTLLTGTGKTEVLLQVNRAAGSTETWHKTELETGDRQRVEITQTLENLKTGDIITLIFAPAGFSTDNYISELATFEVQLQNVVFPGNPVHLEANLPDVSQEDLLLAVLNAFNVLYQTDSVRKTFRLDCLDKLGQQKPVDWSKKIDWNTEPELTFAFGDYGQTNFISYAENEATDRNGNPLVDRMAFDIDNHQLEREKELFTSAFTFTETRGAFRGALALPYIPLFNQAVIEFGLWNPVTDYLLSAEPWVYHNGDYWTAQADNTGSEPADNNPDWLKDRGPRVFEELEATPRLLLVDYSTTPVMIGEDHNPGSTYPFRYFGSFNGLESETLQTDYHTITERLCRQTKLLTLQVRLRLPDINQLDFLRPVILNVPAKNLQGVFFLNKIDQYRPGKYESTQVELARVYGLPLTAEAAAAGHLEFSTEFSDEFN